MPDISIIIPSNKGLTLSQAKSRLADFYDENTMEIIIPTYPNIARARNIGFHKSSGDIIVYIDDDVTVPRELFQSCVNFVRKNSEIIVALYGFAALFYLGSRFIICRRTDFVSFDERLKSRGEDFDWGFKMVEHGITCYLLPEDSVMHIEHSRGRGSNFKLQGHLDHCYLLLKYKRFACHDLTSFIGFFARKPVPFVVRIIAFYIEIINYATDELSRKIPRT